MPAPMDRLKELVGHAGAKKKSKFGSHTTSTPVPMRGARGMNDIVAEDCFQPKKGGIESQRLCARSTHGAATHPSYAEPNSAPHMPLSAITP